MTANNRKIKIGQQINRCSGIEKVDKIKLPLRSHKGKIKKTSANAVEISTYILRKQGKKQNKIKS